MKHNLKKIPIAILTQKKITNILNQKIKKMTKPVPKEIVKKMFKNSKSMK